MSALAAAPIEQIDLAGTAIESAWHLVFGKQRRRRAAQIGQLALVVELQRDRSLCACLRVLAQRRDLAVRMQAARPPDDIAIVILRFALQLAARIKLAIQTMRVAIGIDLSLADRAIVVVALVESDVLAIAKFLLAPQL